jgi:DNA-binding CsgD family transcriptional regulator
MSTDNDSIVRLIELAYKSVDDPQNWEVFLEELASAAGLRVTSISFAQGIDMPLDIALTHAIDDDMIDEFANQIDKGDPFQNAMEKLPTGRRIDLGRAIVPREQFLPTLYYDWLSRLGGDDTLSALEKTEDRGDIYLSGLTPRGELANQDHVALFEAIAPHVFHAISLSRQIARLKIEKRLTRDALSRADFGCAIVDSRGEVDWMNEYARKAVERADAIELDGKRLRAAHPESRSALESALRSALGVEWTDDERADEPKPIFKLQRDGKGQPIEVLVSPLRPLGHPLFGEMQGALVLFSDTEHVDEGVAERLQQIYDLTPTEAEVAQWLMGGASTNEIANIFGNSVHTIRTHVKRVMNKCDASSQVELVGLLQRSLVRLA